MFFLSSFSRNPLHDFHNFINRFVKKKIVMRIVTTISAKTLVYLKWSGKCHYDIELGGVVDIRMRALNLLII